MGAAVIAIVVWVAAMLNGIGEPSEDAMRRAVADSLSEQVRAVVDFVAETEGTVGVARIRRAGTALFEVRSFRKQDCARRPDGDFDCGFSVELGTVAGPLQHSGRGRFRAGPRGFVYSDAA